MQMNTSGKLRAAPINDFCVAEFLREIVCGEKQTDPLR